MDKLNLSPELKMKLYSGLKTALIVFVVVFIFNALFDDRHDRYDNEQQNTITFSGHGEVNAVPDIANVYFSINKEALTVKEAQNLVALVEKSSLDLLKENGVADKDVKTTNASFSPKYEFRYDGKFNTKTGMPCMTYGCPGNNVIVGYTASESITVKVRNTENAGKIMQGLGTLGVTDLNGPNFTIDDEEGLKAEARKEAIADAKTKAKVLAKDLGVRLGKITSFSESGNYPMPMYVGKAMMADSAGAESAPAQLPKGENTISSDVSITYEIR